MNKVVLITGGSRGIGAATARAAARDGWRVVLSYRSNEGAADNVVRDIKLNGGIAEAIRGDISRESDVATIFNRCKDRFGRLDGLVNNAGILPPVGRFEDIDFARWANTFAVNTGGTFLAVGRLYALCRRATAELVAPL